MPRTLVRMCWPDPFLGKVVLNFNDPAIGADSTVLIAASEYTPKSSAVNQKRSVGDAKITVDNIAPHGPPFDNNNGVTFGFTVTFDHPIFVCTDIILLDPPEVHQGGT